jgi:hypothetical protein
LRFLNLLTGLDGDSNSPCVTMANSYDALMRTSAMHAGDRFGGLSKRSAIIIGAAIIIGLVHHTDHVLRVDHSGWPFRPDVNPFTFSLLAYPILLFALLGPARPGNFGLNQPLSLPARIRGVRNQRREHAPCKRTSAVSMRHSTTVAPA